ncbi:g7846 [Coccomyxa viridis]|uniref:DNA-directed RNA polymerase n=1 Tax=Coccomyxa viridis TaxID=1274662 RepID=A0ABP1FYV8_9CHLO
MADNRALVFDTPNETKWSDVVEIRSALDVRQQIAYTTKVKLYRTSPGGVQLGRTIRVRYHNINSDIPMFILFRALGVDSDKEIVRLVVYDMDDTEMIEMLKPSLEEGLMAIDQPAALDYIREELTITNMNTQASEEAQIAYKLRLVRDWLLKYFLPHVGEDMSAKALFLGHMINKLLQSVLGRRSYDDRDHFANKRINSPGALISFLFSQNFSKKLLKSLEKDMRKNLINYNDSVANLKIDNVIKPTVLDTGIKWAFATGTWGLKSSGTSNPVGVAQQLSRINHTATTSYKRRVISQIDKSGKSVVPPRKLHMTQWGVMCPSETPDGEGIGIQKNLALTAYITISTDILPVMTALKGELGMRALSGLPTEEIKNSTRVFVNGDWVGIHYDPPTLVRKLREMRRDGILHIHTGIVWNIAASEIAIQTDGGRVIRPLYIVENNELKITKDIMERLARGELHWNDMLGIGTETTQSEGIKGALIEYLDVAEAETSMIALTPGDLTNNSPKNPVYMNYTHCEIHPSVIFGAVISEVPFLGHNQRPLVTTKTAELIRRDLPNGQNAIVAIMPTSTIGEDGMPMRGKRVKAGRRVDGKSITLNMGADGVAKFNDVSHKVQLGGAGVVDDVRVAINGDGFKFCKVRVRSTRVPEIGDKVQSRHAQKGIIGMILPAEVTSPHVSSPEHAF